MLDFAPAWSRDGRRLALARLTALGASNVNVRDARGRIGDLTRGRGSNFDPVWSPDGKRIAYSSFQSGAAEIWVMSPDGKRIVYALERGASSQLSIVDVASRRERPLLGGGTDLGPSWSPDGRFIVFHGKRGEARYDVWVVHPDGRGLRRLTTATTDLQNVSPTWSPDGSLVLYVRQVVGFGGDTSLASVALDGTPGPALARPGWVIRTPAWQPIVR